MIQKTKSHVIANPEGVKQSGFKSRLLRALHALAMTCICAMFLNGCSRESWLAKFHIVQAEDTFTKAYELRSKKEEHARRLKLYRQSCDHFLQALHLDPKVFTLYRIEMAYQACRWVEDETAAETLRQFEEEYAAAHPTEVEFGDAMPPSPE